MNMTHCSERLSAIYKAQLALKSLFKIITQVDCEARAIQFIHKLEQMSELPQEMHDAIEWFQQDRHESSTERKN